MSYTKLIHGLMGRAQGPVTVIDATGEQFTSDDLDKVGAWADAADDPWLDLVTADGEAVGKFVAGNPSVMDPEPSIALMDGAVYLYDGNPVTDVQGAHYLPLTALEGAVDDGTVEDLYWYLPEDCEVLTPVEQASLTLMMGRRRDEKQGQWKEVTASVGQFQSSILSHQTGTKDGPCFLQGRSAGGARKAVAMVENYVLGIDLDSGTTEAEITEIVNRHGLEAVVYTTHSHLKDTSVIKRDDFLKWCGGEDPSEDLCREYLVEKKGILERVVADLTIVDDAQHTDEGIVILVKHAPIPKYRLILFLKDPFIFAKRGGSQQDAISEWKELYAGVCTDFGLFFDEKCVDPARLFYLPRCPKGSRSHKSFLIRGEPLDLDKFQRVKIRRDRSGKRRATPSNAFTGAGGDDRDESEADRYKFGSFNLVGWAKRFATRFEIENLLQDVGGDIVRDPRGGKPGVHIECPFEAEHSSFGGQGTFVVNASDNYDEGYDNGFSITCVHNACSGRDRLDFLKGMMENGTIEINDLNNKDFLLAIEGEDDEPEVEASTKNITVVDSYDFVNKFEEFDDEKDFDGDLDKKFAAFSKRYAVCLTPAGVKILIRPRKPGDDVRFATQTDISLLEKPRCYFAGSGKEMRKIDPFKEWLEWEDRPTYLKVEFAPGQRTAKGTYNLWRGWSLAPTETTWEDVLENKDEPVAGDWSMLRGHIYENICDSNDEWFQWLMTWMSMIFRKPDAKPGSTVVVTGEKGTGKSTMFDFLIALLGRSGITASKRNQIVGQFNAHLAEALLMVCEEAFWAADPQGEGVLKDMITARTMLIEKKGIDPFQAPNYTRLAMISNSDWVVPASLKDERRFLVLRCSSARRGDIAFFDKMREQMEKKGGLEALLHDLLTWEPLGGSYGVLFTPPHTPYLQQQQIESLSGIEKFMLELVKAGSYQSADRDETTVVLNYDSETLVSSFELRQAVMDYMRYRFASDKAKTSYDEIGVVVKDWFGARETMIEVAGQQNRQRTVVFPPLTVVRDKLRETKGLDIEVMPTEQIEQIRLRR